MRLLPILFVTLTLAGQQIDFSRVFPPQEQQRAELERAFLRLEERRGRVSEAPETAVQRYEDVLRAFERLDAFLYLQASIDTTNTVARDAEEALSAEFERRTAFFIREIARVPEKRIEERYRWFVRSLRENAAPDETVATLQPFALGWQSELHHLLDADPRPPAEKRALYAFTLLRLARSGNAVARLRGFDDAPSAAYARSHLTKSDVTGLLDAVATNAPMYARYQAVRARHTPMPNPPTFSLHDTRAILPVAFAPLGADYVSELSRLLDPNGGRMDVAGGEHRRRGGFSKGFAGFPSVFYMSAFAGTYNDVRIIAHESTHAIQRQLQADRGVPPVYLSGPKFLAEAYAIVNELLLPEHLMERARDRAEKAFFVDQFLQSKGLATIFVSAAEAALEQAVYEGVAAGTLRGADDLDALAQRTAQRFAVPPERLRWWAIRLMYDDPFYDVNYTLAGLVALAIHAKSKSDPRFLPSYARLIANGYTDAPDILLRRFTGIDMHDPNFVTMALRSAEMKIDELEGIYERE